MLLCQYQFEEVCGFPETTERKGATNMRNDMCAFAWSISINRFSPDRTAHVFHPLTKCGCVVMCLFYSMYRMMEMMCLMMREVSVMVLCFFFYYHRMGLLHIYERLGRRTCLVGGPVGGSAFPSRQMKLLCIFVYTWPEVNGVLGVFK